MLTAVNSVSLKLSHLQQDLEVAATQDDAAQVAIPAELKYSTASLGQDDIDTSIGSRLAKRKLVQRTAAERTRSLNSQETSTQRPHTAPMASQQESMDVDEDNPLQAISQMSLDTRESLAKPRAPVATAIESQGSTQTREDRATRGRLAQMVRIFQCFWSLYSRLLTLTQMIPSPQAQNTEETQMVNSPVPQFNTMDFFSQAPRLQLSEVKAKDLEKRKPPRNTRRSKRINDSDDGENISCECGLTHEEDDMVGRALSRASRT